MMQPPVGTVTFLFTDIEGSTKLWQQHPDIMPEALSRHHALLSESITAHDGYIFQIIGDAFCAAFPSANDAIGAALDAQYSLLREAGSLATIKVRMGINSGAAQITDDGQYSGYLTLALTQRIMSAGHGGQVLLSSTTRELLLDSIPVNTELIDLGEKRLKDLSRSEHIYQLQAAGLPRNFPPIKTIDSHPNNLPIQLTTFVGRENEVAEVIQELKTHRLVTLTGSGGTGKTRLSLQVAVEVLEKFAHGVWFTELAPLVNPDLIPQTILTAIGINEQQGKTPLELLKENVREKQMLIILDNCEHLIQACAQVVITLLSAAPKLAVLASSREALGVIGEVSYTVPSMTFPDQKHLPGIEDLAHFESVRLFIDRALLVSPHFLLTQENAPYIAQICRHLDGIPLAIELAAARVKMLSVEQIAARLDDRFHLLTSSSRTNIPRQQTLQAAIDWSYNLLPELERRLFEQLSVFSGGWSLEAAHAISQIDVTFELLESLINKSLVIVDPATSEFRYYYLETLRQYAYEKLVESGQQEIICQRHFNYYLALIETAEAELRGPDMLLWLDRLEFEHDNFRTALEWAVDSYSIESLRMAAALCYFWDRRGFVTEGLNWLKIALEHANRSLDPNDRSNPAFLSVMAKAMAAQAVLAYDHGETQDAQIAAELSTSLARQVGDERTLAWSLSVGAKAIYLLGDVTLARAWAEEALNLSRQQEFSFELGLALSALQMSADPEYLGELNAFCRETLPVLHKWGNPWVLALNTFDAASVADKSGDFIEAQARYDEAARLFHTLGDRQYYTACRSMLAHSLRRQALYSESLAIYRQTIQLWVDLGHLSAVAHELECIGFIAVVRGENHRAAVLFGAAYGIRLQINSPMSSHERNEYEQVLTRLRLQADPADFNKSWSEGMMLTIEQVIEFTLL